MKQLFLLIVLFYAVNSYSQEEKTQEIKEVNAEHKRLNEYRFDTLSKFITLNTLEPLQPNDVGEVLQKVPGVQVKSFGGLGGLKTVSIRGLGGNHTTVVKDGFTMPNGQVGQTNFAQIQTDDIIEIGINRGNKNDFLVPVSAQLLGNTIIINTKHATAPSQPIEKHVVSKFGSFGLVDHNILAKTGSQKLSGSMFLKFRHAHGEYPFQLQNYNELVKELRNNNDFTDICFGTSAHYTINEKHKLSFYYQHFQVDQGLPGAVVLYNNHAKQRLYTNNHQLKLDYKGQISKVSYRWYTSAQKDSIKYTDPNYLNSAHELKSFYKNYSMNSGIVFKMYSEKLNGVFNFGSEETFMYLNGYNSFDSKPTRWTNQSFINFTKNLGKVTLTGQLGTQLVHERKSNADQTVLFRWHPFVEAHYTLSENGMLYGFYRNSMRLPTFNELYYGQIGNTNLLPEEANQLATGINYKVFSNRKVYLQTQTGLFAHHVNNKIIATPTKNLFVWSIQNVGRALIYGADLSESFTYRPSKKWEIHLNANYSWQKNLDRTEREGPTFNHQLAYSPEHTANIDLGIQRKNTGVKLMTFYASKRYSLNENIIQNQVPEFYTIDAAIYTKHHFDKVNSLLIQLTIKNITNNQYAYVRNFVMPGTNVLITFKYAFK